MAWTDDKIETLRRMWADEETGNSIAAALGGGISKSAVIAKAHRLGLPSRINPADWETAWGVAYDAIVEDFATMTEAARRSGLSLDSLRRMWEQRVLATHGGDPA